MSHQLNHVFLKFHLHPSYLSDMLAFGCSMPLLGGWAAIGGPQSCHGSRSPIHFDTVIEGRPGSTADSDRATSLNLEAEGMAERILAVIGGLVVYELIALGVVGLVFSALARRGRSRWWWDELAAEMAAAER